MWYRYEGSCLSQHQAATMRLSPNRQQRPLFGMTRPHDLSTRFLRALFDLVVALRTRILLDCFALSGAQIKPVRCLQDVGESLLSLLYYRERQQLVAVTNSGSAVILGSRDTGARQTAVEWDVVMKVKFAGTAGAAKLQVSNCNDVRKQMHPTAVAGHGCKHQSTAGGQSFGHGPGTMAAAAYFGVCVGRSNYKWRLYL